MSYGVRLSDELRAQVLLQPAQIREEFWAVHDQIEKFGAPRSYFYGQQQMELPLDHGDGQPMTRPFGCDGWVVFRALPGEGPPAVEILHIEWPAEVDRA